MENGKKFLSVRLNKALYGKLKVALIFYQKLTGRLKHCGFKLNPYETCVVNTTIDRKKIQYCGILMI